MFREVWEVQKRCDKCGVALRLLVCDSGLGEDGEPYQAVYVDRVPHDRQQCERMLTIAREEWPALF
jgi:hypothetical protein